MRGDGPNTRKKTKTHSLILLWIQKRCHKSEGFVYAIPFPLVFISPSLTSHEIFKDFHVAVEFTMITAAECLN